MTTVRAGAGGALGLIIGGTADGLGVGDGAGAAIGGEGVPQADAGLPDPGTSGLAGAEPDALARGASTLAPPEGAPLEPTELASRGGGVGRKPPGGSGTNGLRIGVVGGGPDCVTLGIGMVASGSE
jgi:hypothetical protein